MIAPMPTIATPALSGLFAARGGATALNMGSGYFIRPDGNKQKWSPPPSYGGAPAQQNSWDAPAPAPPQQYQQPPQQSYAPAPANYGAPAAGAPAQNAGDLPPSGWGSETLAHSRNPTPTQLDPNDPKSKMTHIPAGESFQEYMARRAREGK